MLLEFYTSKHHISKNLNVKKGKKHVKFLIPNSSLDHIKDKFQRLGYRKFANNSKIVMENSLIDLFAIV